MSDDINNTKEKMKLAMLGQRIRAGHAQQKPIGDRMINAVRGAIWEAWEMGLDKSGSTYPTLTLLDQLTQPGESTDEKRQPLFSRHTYIEKRWQHPALNEPEEPETPGEPVEPIEPEW